MTRQTFGIAFAVILLLVGTTNSATLKIGSVTKSSTTIEVPSGQNFAVSGPATVLSGNAFSLTLTLAPIQCKLKAPTRCTSWPEKVDFKVSVEGEEGKKGNNEPREQWGQ